MNFKGIYTYYKSPR